MGAKVRQGGMQREICRERKLRVLEGRGGWERGYEGRSGDRVWHSLWMREGSYVVYSGERRECRRVAFRGCQWGGATSGSGTRRGENLRNIWTFYWKCYGFLEMQPLGLGPETAFRRLFPVLLCRGGISSVRTHADSRDQLRRGCILLQYLDDV